jgi:hypothetical protein
MFLHSPKSGSQIVLALLSTGEAYLCDLRKTERSRIELVELMEESDDEQGQSTRTRYVFALVFPWHRPPLLLSGPS